MQATINESIITCPECGFAKQEVIPAKSCQITYRCTACGADLWPTPGDCCVYSTYGSVPCQAIQVARAQPANLSRNVFQFLVSSVRAVLAVQRGYSVLSGQ